MPLVVNTNVGSMRAQNSVAKSQGALQKSFQRLSSGFRINQASDDAAGMGISESLKARIRSFSVAERNTNNAVSMTNTAEGGLNQISGIISMARRMQNAARRTECHRHCFRGRTLEVSFLQFPCTLKMLCRKRE